MTRSIRLFTLSLVLCGALTVLIGCGGVVSPPPTASTTLATAPGAAAGDAVQTAQRYQDEIRGWMESYFFDETGEPVIAPDFSDISQPTDQEIRDAREFAASMRGAVSALEAINAPAEVATAHRQLCSALRTELAALERMITGIEHGNQRDIELAFRDASEAYTVETAALNALSEYVDLAGLIRN